MDNLLHKVQSGIAQLHSKATEQVNAILHHTGIDPNFDVPVGGGRRLIVCMDGTWDSPGSSTDSESMGGVKQTASLVPSNIVKLAYLLGSGRNQWENDPTEHGIQKVYYHSGVGTEVQDKKNATLEGQFGNIHLYLLDAYAWLANEYQPGDEIYAFGFSRGATIVRSLFSFIRFAGLAKPDGFADHASLVTHIQEAFEHYKGRKSDEADHSASAERFKQTHCYSHVYMKFLGVFDTVSALNVPQDYSKIVSSSILTTVEKLMGSIEPNDYHDLHVGYDVQYGYQALAIDENREFFPPEMFEHLEADKLHPGHIREQKWFRGSHADIGGGWWETGLSEIPLNWMIEKAREAGLSVRPLEVFDQNFTPFLLGVSKNDYGRRKQVMVHDYFAINGLKDTSPLGKKVPRDLKALMDTSKYGVSELHESVLHLFPGQLVPDNLKAFF
ncbi:hypothetical protein BC830DRAFT_1111693 [Chytriomyces sp. MP71]|nr:hypothetical protein BC830DRAFT_1111693 [Chytriomyces sp. MP71]